jgi:hypothetical protein
LTPFSPKNKAWASLPFFRLSVRRSWNIGLLLEFMPQIALFDCYGFCYGLHIRQHEQPGADKSP